jgi:hypothetical protein
VSHACGRQANMPPLPVPQLRSVMRMPISSLRLLRGLPLVAGLMAAVATTLGAQVVHGEVREAGTGEPVNGAFVIAIDAEGERVAGVLADRSGAFRLRLREPGTFRLRAERIGYETATSEPFPIARGETREMAMRLASRAIALEGITVEGRQRCVLRPEEGLAVHALWEEARKALEVSSFVEEARLYRFRSALYARELEPDGVRVRRELETRTRTGYGTPFASLPPAELMDRGFARRDGDGWILYAPDAHVLLSDEFLDTHCFRITEGKDAGLVGLAFEPVPGRRLPEVRGVLWLDRGTGELRHLEYGYLNIPIEGRERLGGRVDFRMLDGGAWIVQQWWIRSPMVTIEEGARRRVLIDGLREDGGEVIAVLTPSGRPVDGTVHPALAGMVFDSIRGTPLPGARVFLDGTQYSAETDEAGYFEMTGVRPGRYGIAFTHPRLDSLRLIVPPTELEVLRDGSAEVVLAVPSAGTLAAAACEAAGDPGRAVGGIVRNDLSGVPLPGAEVTLEWQTEGRTERRRTEADAGGVYRFCGVPAGASIALTARFLGTAGEPQEVAWTAGAAGVHQDLGIPLPQPAGQVAGDAGQVRLAGRLLDETGAPVGGARVRLVGADRSATTGRDGRFVFADLAPGEEEIEVSHESFGSRTETVVLRGGPVLDLELSVPSRVIALEGLTVTVRGAAAEVRRRSGAARTIVAGEEMADFARRGARVGDVLRTRAVSLRIREGTFVTPSEPSTPQNLVCVESSRGSSRLAPPPGAAAGVPFCDMLPVHVDGVRIHDPGTYLRNLHAGEIESVEVLSGVEATMRFGLDHGGGAVVIHTRGTGPYRSAARDG